MTANEFLIRLDNLESVISKLSLTAFIPIMNNVKGIFLRRIFNNGQDINGGKIGSYSTTQPDYVDIDAFTVKSAFKPDKRKRAVNKGKSPGPKGSLRTTVDLMSGYSELREMQGFQTGYVDLMYSGSLMTSIAVGVEGNKIVLKFISQTETIKGRGNEKHFGKTIFSLSNIEKALLTADIMKYINNLIKTTLQNK